MQNATPIWPPEKEGFFSPGRENRIGRYTLWLRLMYFHMTTKEQLFTITVT